MSWANVNVNWEDLIKAGASLVGSVSNARAGDKAADAQVKGDAAAIAEQRRQFDLIMQMLQPQINTGTQALNTLNSLYGYTPYQPPAYAPGAPATAGSTGNALGRPSTLNRDAATGLAAGAITGNPLAILPALFNDTSTREEQIAMARTLASRVLGRANGGTSLGSTGVGIDPATGSVTQGVQVGASPLGATPQAPQAPAAPNLGAFFASPDYNFRRSEGMRGIENSFAARGGAASGNALRALNEFNSNLASGEFGNFFNRTAALAGIGQAATNQGVGAAQFSGGNISNLLSNQGNARASGIISRGNAISSGLNDLASIYGIWQANRGKG